MDDFQVAKSGRDCITTYHPVFHHTEVHRILAPSLQPGATDKNLLED